METLQTLEAIKSLEVCKAYAAVGMRPYLFVHYGDGQMLLVTAIFANYDVIAAGRREICCNSTPVWMLKKEDVANMEDILKGRLAKERKGRC